MLDNEINRFKNKIPLENLNLTKIKKSKSEAIYVILKLTE